MVYVGIVSFNTLSDLPGCIASVKRQSQKDIRIIVFDNNSSDGSVAWLRKQKGIMLIPHDENIGFGRAHNAIINSVHLGKNDYYLALNPDVRLGRRYISELVAVVKTKGAYWATGKLYKDASKKTLYSAGHGLLKDGYALNIGYDLPDGKIWNVAREVFGAPGAAPLYSSKLIRSLSVSGSFFDPRMFLYYEDIDVDWRARLSGFHCWYSPRATAVHAGGKFRSSYEIEALGNRYAGVLKNASVADLVTYNIPRIGMHVLFRLVLSPRKGFLLLGKAMRAVTFLRARTPWRVSRSYMHRWFAWSAGQPTGQPVTPIGRLSSFWGQGRREMK